MPQEPSEIRRIGRKARAEAKQLALKTATVTSPNDEQTKQLLPTKRQRCDIEICVDYVNI